MRVIIAGPRNFFDAGFVSNKIKHFLGNTDWSLVCGEATGVDTIARTYCEANGIDIDSYPADWDNLGKAAGPIRNKQMAQNADALLAFWDGKSPGTTDMIKTAKRLGLEIRKVKI